MPIHRISRLGVNAYIVDEEDGLTLVDTMLPRSAKPILAAARDLGRPIVRIALTHAHGDHVGSLDALADELPGVEVLISARDARLLAKDMTLAPNAAQLVEAGYELQRVRPVDLFPQTPHIECVALLEAGPNGVANPDRD